MNAGHCPPILRRSNGAVESLAPTRPVLGFMLDEGFRSERLDLAAGDRLLLYTDGVTEAANDSGEEFGPERLTELLECPADEDLQRHHANIIDNVRRHAAGNFTDDATLLLISMNASQPAAAARPAPRLEGV